MLSVKDLSLGINGTQILNGISFEVPTGQTLGIIGPNGSGKTTLFNCLSGFNLPASGSIFFNNYDITSLPAFERAARGIGRVFQNFGIFKEMSLLENIVTALESKKSSRSLLWPWGKESRELWNAAYDFLAQVGLQSKAKNQAGSLSGGQMRLLEIIRTLAFGAECFLLDEPTAGVSPKMKEDVGGLIRKLRELKRTILLIEHDITFIQKFCDRIIVLDVGKVVLDDTPENVRSSKLLQEIYFGNG